MGAFGRARLIRTIGTIFKAAPRKALRTQKAFLLPLLFRLNKKCKTMLEDVLKWAWRVTTCKAP